MKNKIPEGLVGRKVEATVCRVALNKWTRNAEVTVEIEGDDGEVFEMQDTVFAQSDYATNIKKMQIYGELFNDDYRDARRFCKHLTDNVDFEKYEYKLVVELKVSKKGAKYFVVDDFRRLDNVGKPDLANIA